MRTIHSRLALIVVLAMAAPALVVHGQQNPEAMPQAGLVRLLDEDKVAFGVTVDARADPVALSANDDIDFVFFDMEHGPYDVSALRTWMQWLLNPAAIAVTGDAMAGKAVIVRIPATGRELDQNIWMVKQVLGRGCARHHLPDGRDPGAGAHGHPRHALPAEAGCPDPEPRGCGAPIPGSRRATGPVGSRTTLSGLTSGGWIRRTATCCPGSSSRARSGWPTCARSPASSASGTSAPCCSPVPRPAETC